MLFKDQSSNKLSLKQLKIVFQRCIKLKADNRRRLLLIDGHSSHINIKFINTYNKYFILLFILPPYTIYRLQPLDVSLFGPLTIYYTQGLNQLLVNSLDIVSILNVTAWPITWSCSHHYGPNGVLHQRNTNPCSSFQVLFLARVQSVHHVLYNQLLPPSQFGSLQYN